MARLFKVEGLVSFTARGGSSPLGRIGKPAPAGFFAVGCFVRGQDPTLCLRVAGLGSLCRSRARAEYRGRSIIV
jgi:hypothetical protein